MNKLSFLIISLILFLTFVKKNYACTGFVIYTEMETFYCMNFDYPDYEILFQLEDIGVDTTVFTAGFMYGGYSNKYFGFNSQGNFSTFQQLYPEFELCNTAPNIDLGVAWTYFVNWFTTVDGFLDFLDFTEMTVVKISTLPDDFHILMADKTGNSMILEPIDTGHELTFSDTNFQVMANFPIYQFQDVEYTEVSGVGASRYINTYEYLENNNIDFDLDKCINALQISMQTSGSYKTQTSLIANPKTNEIYIILNRDFEHIWKASIKDRNICTYQGFDEEQTIYFDDDGISENELLAMLVDVENITNERINIYPNPAKDIININGIKAKSIISISDINGRKVFEKNIESSENETINIENLFPGVYFLNIENKIITEKLKFIKN